MSNSIYGHKSRRYDTIAKQLTALFEGERDYLANTANLSAVVYEQVPGLNWVGAYFYRDEQLILGPFQGKVACVRIALDKGVCGKAATTREPQVIGNVHEFPGHIACDSASNSEIVIPMIKKERLIGVFDVDSPIFNRFDEYDLTGMQKLVRIFVEATDFPAF